MLGYTVQEECSKSIQDELTATALVLTDGTLKLAIVACDILHIQNPHCDRIRAHIARRTSIPAANVLLNFSHTHLGPMLPGWQPETDDQSAIQQRYLDFLTEALAGAVGIACDRLQPARIGSARAAAPLGVNRREKLADGRVIIGENPEGPIDRDGGRRPGRRSFRVGRWRRLVRRPPYNRTGTEDVGPVARLHRAGPEDHRDHDRSAFLFLQGAAGNINPACGIGAGGAEQYDDLARLGAMLGGEVLKTWAQIRTHNRRGPRRIVQSVAALSTWDYEPAPDACVEHFGVARKRLVLDMAPLPDRDRIQNQLEHFRREREAVFADSGSSRGRRHVADRMLQWAAACGRLS